MLRFRQFPIMILLAAFSLGFSLSGCRTSREIAASPPYVNPQYLRTLEKVFVIINMPVIRNPERIAEYLKQELEYMFLREDVEAEVVIDDDAITGEQLGARLDMFAPQHVMTIATNETQALEVNLYDEMEGVRVYNVIIRVPSSNNVVNLAQQIAEQIGTNLRESNLL